MVRASLCGVLYLLYRTPGGKSTSKSALLYTRRGWAQFRRAVQRRQGFRQALAGRKEGEDRTFCKKPAFGSAPKGGSKGGRRRPSRRKGPVYKTTPKDRAKHRLFLRALRPATQLHRRDGPANAPTLLGERKEYAGKRTGENNLVYRIAHRCAGNWYRNKADPIKAGPCICTGLLFAGRCAGAADVVQQRL